MAQRMNTLNTKLSRDTTANCDAYLAKLIKRGFDYPIMNAPRAKGVSPSRCVPPTNPIPSTRRMLRNSSAPLTRKSTPRESSNMRECMYHRENSSTRKHVPIMETRICKSPTRKLSRHRSTSPNSSTKESWDRIFVNRDRIIQKRPPKIIGSFSSFDPLRTLHFLGSELKNRLRQKLPEDTEIQQMITSMQDALIRIPKDVERLGEILNSEQSGHKSRINVKPSNPKLAAAVPKVNKAIQTPIDLVPDIESLQKQLEASTIKLENSCKQMEELSGQLTNEKEELTMLLQAEKETVKALRKQIESMEQMKSEEMGKIIIEYQREAEGFEETIKNLNAKNQNLQANLTKSIDGLKGVLLKTAKEKQMLENDHRAISHELSLACLEKEKLKAVLAVRERQIDEIRSEMDLLQEVVSQELCELKDVPCPNESYQINTVHPPRKPNSPKSGKRLAPNFERIVEGAAIIGAHKEDGDKNLTMSSIESGRKEIQQLYGNMHQMRANVSLESSDTSACLHEMQRNGLLDNYSRVSDETSTAKDDEDVLKGKAENQDDNERLHKDSTNDTLFKPHPSENTKVSSEDTQKRDMSSKLSEDSLQLDSDTQIMSFQKKMAQLEKDIMMTLKDDTIDAN